MTKKLLLTTALLSALSSGTTANATDFEIAYNGNNTYTFDGANYASLTLLAQNSRLVFKLVELLLKMMILKLKKIPKKLLLLI